MKNSKTKKILSILLAVMMVVGMIPATAIPVSAADEATCPIEGATGSGTKDDPVIVDTYYELRDALGYQRSELYIQLDEDIECEETVSESVFYHYEAALNVMGTKTLILNGTLSSIDVGVNTISVFSEARLTVKGTGKIVSPSRCIDCINHQYGAAGVVIEGNVTFEGNDEEGIIETANCQLTIKGVFLVITDSQNLSSLPQPMVGLCCMVVCF